MKYRESCRSNYENIINRIRDSEIDDEFFKIRAQKRRSEVQSFISQQSEVLDESQRQLNITDMFENLQEELSICQEILVENVIINESLETENAKLKFQLMYTVGLLTSKSEECDKLQEKAIELEASQQKINKMQSQIDYTVQLLEAKSHQNNLLRRETRQKQK